MFDSTFIENFKFYLCEDFLDINQLKPFDRKFSDIAELKSFLENLHKDLSFHFPEIENKGKQILARKFISWFSAIITYCEQGEFSIVFDDLQLIIRQFISEYFKTFGDWASIKFSKESLNEDLISFKEKDSNSDFTLIKNPKSSKPVSDVEDDSDSTSDQSSDAQDSDTTGNTDNPGSVDHSSNSEEKDTIKVILPFKKPDLSFVDLYPDLDHDQLLSDLYDSFMEKVKSKSFYKTILFYRNDYATDMLPVDEPSFLWQLVKSISSAITHLTIEAEQNQAASYLFETFYDGLVDCLNNVVHAKDESDIIVAFEHMLNFLNLSIDEEVESSDSDEDDFGSSNIEDQL